jgi:hypothetical protein
MPLTYEWQHVWVGLGDDEVVDVEHLAAVQERQNREVDEGALG